MPIRVKCGKCQKTLGVRNRKLARFGFVEFVASGNADRKTDINARGFIIRFLSCKMRWL